MNTSTRTIKLNRDSSGHTEDVDAPFPWVVLVVDDEQSVLDVTKNVLKRFRFMDRGLLIQCARSFAEAKSLYLQYPRAAVALVDCTMEQDTSGLEFVEFVRKEKKNNTIQLVLRTGQPGFAPERQVLLDYEINDYLSKTELTSTKLNLRMISYLRAYENLNTIATQKNELAELNQNKDNFMYTVSHELTSPLRASDGLLAMLVQEKDKLPAESLKYVQLIEGCNQRMLLLIRDLVDTSMIRRNTFRMSFGRQNLFALVEEIVPNLDILSRYLYKQDQIAIINNINASLPEVSVDKSRIQQVVINLVSNALKFTETGSVTLSADYVESKNAVYVSVIDTGIGIEPQDLDTIFAAFSQVNSERSLSVKGLGLGLFICQKIVEGHGGEFMVSSNPGDGATFTFVLPVATDAP